MLDFFSFVDGPLVEHRSICMDEKEENDEEEITETPERE